MTIFIMMASSFRSSQIENQKCRFSFDSKTISASTARQWNKAPPLLIFPAEENVEELMTEDTLQRL
jgi:hypothetical protein